MFDYTSMMAYLSLQQSTLVSKRNVQKVDPAAYLKHVLQLCGHGIVGQFTGAASCLKVVRAGNDDITLGSSLSKFNPMSVTDSAPYDITHPKMGFERNKYRMLKGHFVLFLLFFRL